MKKSTDRWTAEKVTTLGFFPIIVVGTQLAAVVSRDMLIPGLLFMLAVVGLLIALPTLSILYALNRIDRKKWRTPLRINWLYLVITVLLIQYGSRVVWAERDLEKQRKRSSASGTPQPIGGQGNPPN